MWGSGWSLGVGWGIGSTGDRVEGCVLRGHGAGFGLWGLGGRIIDFGPIRAISVAIYLLQQIFSIQGWNIGVVGGIYLL
jgi:hypothetical protein